TACIQNLCDPKTGQCGLQPAALNTPCSDGSACTASAACKAGVCAVTASVDCNDGDACTTDTCDALVGCVHKQANCSDGNPCTVDQCDPKTSACSFSAGPMEGKGCDADQNGCTVNDVCKAGTCLAGPAVLCKLALDACQVAACQSSSSNSFACVALPAVDGTPCSGTAPCALGHACQKGQCQPVPGDKLFVKELGSFGAGLAVQAIAPSSDVGLAGGVRWTGPDGAPSGAALVLFGVGADASPVWQVEVPSAGAADARVGVAGVRTLAGGDRAAVATRRFSANGDLDLWATRLSSDGKVFVADKQVVQAGDEVALGADHAALVGWWVAGQQGSGGAARGTLWRLTEGGSVLASWKSAAQSEEALHAAVIQPDGGALAAGWRLVSGAKQGWLVRVDGQGNLQWQKVLAASLPQQFLAAGAASSGPLLAGTRDGATGSLPLVLRVDGAGNVLASLVGTAVASPRSIVAQPGGQAVVAGAAGNAAWIQGQTASFEPLWSVSHAASAPAHWNAVAAGPDGGLWLVGARSGPTRALVGRSDPWGHLLCASAGDCASKLVDICDDGAACTFDLCEPGSGCVHAPTSSPCSDGNACTAGDQCLAGTCTAGAPTGCDDGNPCTADGCDTKLGCTHAAYSGGCDDGNACTEGDACQGTSCAGKAKVCDDGSVCTADTCHANTGCTFAPNPNACDDGNVCTDDTCDKQKGCAHAANTAPCDAGDPCLEGDKCAAGQCVAGTLATHYAKTWAGGVGNVYPIERGAAERDDGGFDFVGYNYKDATHHYAFVGRTLPGGATTLTATWPTTAPSALYRIAKTSTGWVAAGGTMLAGAGAWDGWLRKAAASGQEIWSYTYGGAADDYLIAVIPHGQGVIAAGQTKSSGAGGYDGWIVRVTADGVVEDAATLGGDGDDWFNAAASTLDGGLVAVGATNSSGAGAADGWIVRQDAAGAVLWKRTYGTLGADSWYSVAALDDGSFAVVGQRNGAHNAVAVVDQAGYVRRYIQTATASSPYVVAAAGGFAVANDGLLARYDNAGSLLWGRNLPLGYGATGLEALSDGGFLAFGWYAQLVRTDAWGYTSCTGGKECAGKSVAACGDSDPCTTPTCDQAKGCGTAANTESCTSTAACSTGDTCSAGQCVPGKPRLYDIAVGTANVELLSGVVRSRLGGAIVVGSVSTAASTLNPWLARVDGSGTPIWQASEAVQSPWVTLWSAVELPDGRIAAAGAEGTQGLVQPSVFVFTAEGGLIASSAKESSYSQGTFKGNTFLDVDARDDGDLVAAGVTAGSSTTGNGAGVVARLTDRAKMVWSTQVPSTRRLYTVSAKSGGAIEVWGVGTKDSDVVRLTITASGSVGGTKTWATPGFIYRVGSADMAGGGAIVAASIIPGAWTNQQKLGRVLVMRVDAVGNTLWQRMIQGADERIPFDVVATGAGAILVGTIEHKGQAAGYSGWLAGIDGAGNLGWERDLGGSGLDQFGGGAMVDGNLVAVGYTDSKGNGSLDGWLVRADAWGQGGCPVAGPCVKLVAEACMDGDPCTADSCSPITGCVHAEQACDDNNPCTADACDPAKGCVWAPLDSPPANACGTGFACVSGFCSW
ncbi:MAG: hypothetical protein HY902_17115, partial [Deltaproteobacteria bacterium]|nr:hypothetical protein [Deltaproteobacteria bacterium]